jgi:hypothetical protein
MGISLVADMPRTGALVPFVQTPVAAGERRAGTASESGGAQTPATRP